MSWKKFFSPYTLVCFKISNTFTQVSSILFFRLHKKKLYRKIFFFFFFWLPAFLFTLDEVFFLSYQVNGNKNYFPHVHKFALKISNTFAQVSSILFFCLHKKMLVQQIHCFFGLLLQTRWQWRSCVCYFEHNDTNISGEA